MINLSFTNEISLYEQLDRQKYYVFSVFHDYDLRKLNEIPTLPFDKEVVIFIVGLSRLRSFENQDVFIRSKVFLFDVRTELFSENLIQFDAIPKGDGVWRSRKVTGNILDILLTEMESGLGHDPIVERSF